MYSFKENIAQTRTYSNTLFTMRGNHVRVHGTKQGITSVSCIFHIFKYVVITSLRVRHSTKHIFTETLCFSPFNVCFTFFFIAHNDVNKTFTYVRHLKIRCILLSYYIFILIICHLLLSWWDWVNYVTVKAITNNNYFLLWRKPFRLLHIDSFIYCQH